MPSIKRHSIEKLRAHNHNVQIFATATKNDWPQRAYIGLYSGPGRAVLDDTGAIVETTGTSVFRLPDAFTHYVFVDNNPECTDALRRRIDAIAPTASVTVLTGDANSLVNEIKSALPPFSRDRGLLSYCFVDPFDAGLKFATIKALGQLRMDFLILLMTGVDARRNLRRYLSETNNTRIGDLIDAPDWRKEWTRSGEDLVPFLLRKFNEAMVRIGYREPPTEDAYPVRVHGKNVLLYHLVYYSRHELGQSFWRATRRGVPPQGDLFL